MIFCLLDAALALCLLLAPLVWVRWRGPRHGRWCLIYGVWPMVCVVDVGRWWSMVVDGMVDGVCEKIQKRGNEETKDTKKQNTHTCAFALALSACACVLYTIVR